MWYFHFPCGPTTHWGNGRLINIFENYATKKIVLMGCLQSFLRTSTSTGFMLNEIKWVIKDMAPGRTRNRKGPNRLPWTTRTCNKPYETAKARSKSVIAVVARSAGWPPLAERNEETHSDTSGHKPCIPHPSETTVTAIDRMLRYRSMHFH